MKNKYIPYGERQSKNNKLMVVVGTLILLALLVCKLLLQLTKSSPAETAPVAEPEIESYIRSKVVQQDIVLGMLPAAIYIRRPGTTQEAFFCVGTMFNDTNNETRLVTAEHIFRTNSSTPRILSVRALRGEMTPPVAYVSGILATGRKLGGVNQDERDIVITSLGLSPVEIKPYSGFLNEISKNFWGEVKIGNTEIPRLRSLLSGEYVKTLGYTKRGTGTNAAMFVIVECHVRPGESGTGYVDDCGGLWVVHAGVADKEEEQRVIEECWNLTGRKIHAVATVSGPIFGSYQ